MTMKFIVADVKMNEFHTQQVIVGPWEIPVLQCVHGGHVNVVGEQLVERDAPDAQQEFDRLLNKYRSGHDDEGDSKLPYVVQVYGQRQVGRDALADAIQAAVVATLPVIEHLHAKPEKQKSAAVI